MGEKVTVWKNKNLEKLSENELCELPVIGKNPWHPSCTPIVVWAWDEKRNEVLIGYCLPFEIITYQEAIVFFKYK